MVVSLIVPSPHYHVIIFGQDFNDLKKRGDLDEAWNRGITHCGSVASSSISYVVSYSVGKYNGRLLSFYAERNITPEFALMSRRPGLRYLDKRRTNTTKGSAYYSVLE